MNLDRTIAPGYKEIDTYVLPEANTIKLDNGIPLHFIQSGLQPAVRLELIFKGGNWYEPVPGCAHFAIKMLAEGTTSKSAKEIQEMFAYYGAFPEFSSGMDHASITVYALSKHLQHLLPLLVELVSEATFPENELDALKNISRQTLKVNQEKTAFLAGSKYRELLFGATHPYGYFLSDEAIEAVQSTALSDFYNKNFTTTTCEIVLSGGFEEGVEKLINNTLGTGKWGKADKHPFTGKEHTLPAFTKQVVIEKADALQSSIRMGRKMFTLDHPDYSQMYCLNELFGGYFGSRLMQNIREEKGYTYGISSNLVHYKKEGYWVIGTDVKKEFATQTLEEIYKEMRKLREEKIESSELETVRNYMLGSFVNSINTPFAIADKFKTIHFNGLDYGFYRHYFKTLQSITADSLHALAVKYFDENAMTEVIAG
jgi:zinc protease